MKILVFTKNWLGDILFQLPAIERIRKNYPQAEIVCLCPPRCEGILRSQPSVNRLILFDEKTLHRSWLKKLSFVMDLRKERWDKAFFLHRSSTRAMLLWLAGVKERIGYASKREFLLTRAILEPEKPLHHVDYNLEMLEKAGLSTNGEANYQFYFSDHDADLANQLLEKFNVKDYVCFHLGANWEPKRWPITHFSKLADLIHKRYALPIVLTGASDDLNLALRMTQYVQNARVVTLTAQTNLGQLGALFKRAKFVVSGDSGPMHIASGVGARVLALFGPTDPNLTGPRGIGESAIMSFVPKGCRIPWMEKYPPPSDWLAHIYPTHVMAELEKRKWLP